MARVRQPFGSQYRQSLALREHVFHGNHQQSKTFVDVTTVLKFTRAEPLVWRSLEEMDIRSVRAGPEIFEFDLHPTFRFEQLRA